jgi:hypothetical protein
MIRAGLPYKTAARRRCPLPSSVRRSRSVLTQLRAVRRGVGFAKPVGALTRFRSGWRSSLVEVLRHEHAVGVTSSSPTRVEAFGQPLI